VQGTAHLTVSFTDTSEGGVTSWLWDFGDGSTSADHHPVHVYEDPGIYTTRLTVSDEKGNVNSLEKVHYIRVSDMSPEAAFASSSQEGPAPLIVAFIDTSKGVVTSRKWDFGDGAQSTAKNPLHAYMNPGIYTVSLHVSASVGETTEIKEHYIRVTEPGPAVFLRTISGRITGAETEGQEVLLTGPRMQRTAITGSDGSFNFGGVYAGTYSITPRNEGFVFDPPSRHVMVLSEDISGMDFTACTGGPVLELLHAVLPITPADGETPITLLAKVSHAFGFDAISEVSIDLRPIGGVADQPMYDDGTHEDETAADGIFTMQTTVATGTQPGLQMLPVKAVDTQGNEAKGCLPAGISQTQSGQLVFCGTWEESVDVSRFASELVITVDIPQTSEGQFVLEIYKPYGLEWRWWDNLHLTEMQTQYSIKNPVPGRWHYRINHVCDAAGGLIQKADIQQAETISLTVNSVLRGFGSIGGRVIDAETGEGVKNALVQVGCFIAHTDENGFYARTLPSGLYATRVHAFGHMRLKKSVHIEEYHHTVFDAVIDRWFRHSDEAEDE
ncbi:MAG: PKD domain-containing protein, partial [Syntrophaceae bacterium]|nr:PKD domain-containing protein [Syntrophaceae bacterium]